MDYQVLILGSDANAYYMARCAYEYDGHKAHLIAKDRLAFTKFSSLLTIEYVPNLWNDRVLINKINEFANQYNKMPVLLVSTNETYSLMIANHQSELASNLRYFKQDAKVLNTLANKELFYKTYKNKGLSFPETYYYDLQNSSILPSMNYPCIVKPSNVVTYNHLDFMDKHKIYQIHDELELKKVIHQIKEASYKDPLIIQEYIKGDDSYLFDAVVYVDRFGKVKVISFARIGLQEHSKSMVGNAACLINGYNGLGGNTEKMKACIIKFMENLKMNGFFEFDMKYDQTTQEFKVLEINARQGRCSYYITKGGANLIEVMVKDLIDEKELSFMDITKEIFLTFVPKYIVKKYILDESFKRHALSLWHKRISPMECPKDRSFLRFLMMKKRLCHYLKEYQNSYWEE